MKISTKLFHRYMAIFFNFPLTSNHLHPLQIDNYDSNSRLVVDEDDNDKFRLERVKNKLWHQSSRFENSWPLFCHIWIIFPHLKLWIASDTTYSGWKLNLIKFQWNKVVVKGFTFSWTFLTLSLLCTTIAVFIPFYYLVNFTSVSKWLERGAASVTER